MRKISASLIIPYVFIFLLLGFAAYRVNNISKTSSVISSEVEGTILKHPYIKNGMQTFEIEGITVKTGLFPRQKLGDKLKVINPSADKKKSSVDNKNKDENENKYANLAVWYYPRIEKLGENALFSKIFHFRENIIKKVQKVLPEPHASLVLGMTIGYQDDIPEDFSSMLKRVGIVHVVVVSGYNVTLVLSLISIVLMRLGKVIFFLGSFATLLAFLVLVGLDPPVIRAVIMGIIGTIALVFGQQKSSLYLLIITGLLMVIINPAFATGVSFQMTFLATFVIILLSQTVRKFSGLVSEFIIIACVNLAVLPIISYYFGTVSLLGFITNSLLLWIVPFVTILGTLYMFFSVFLLSVALIIQLDFFVFVCELISGFNFGVYEYKIDVSIMTLYYLVYFTFLRVLYLFGRDADGDCV